MQALEAALEKQPKDGDLAAQIGAALVSTHQYRRALDYYHKAVRNSPANRPLQLHLARLLLRLKSWDSAEKVWSCLLCLANTHIHAGKDSAKMLMLHHSICTVSGYHVCGSL